MGRYINTWRSGFFTTSGEADFDDPYTIDDQGQLRLPEVGLIKVAGLTVIDAEQRIRQKLASIYRNLDEFKLTIVEQLIRVKVLGYVEKPEPYHLNLEVMFKWLFPPLAGQGQGHN